MGFVRLNPLHGGSPDQECKYRVFGNTEAYELSTEDKKEIRHGLVKTEEPPTLEYVQNWLDKMAYPMKLEASNMDWSSYFKINERIANGYRRERAFLIGGIHLQKPTDIYVLSTVYSRCRTLSFSSWWSRNEFGTSGWLVKIDTDIYSCML